jgi:hypothetical protein
VELKEHDFAAVVVVVVKRYSNTDKYVIFEKINIFSYISS